MKQFSLFSAPILLGLILLAAQPAAAQSGTASTKAKTAAKKTTPAKKTKTVTTDKKTASDKDKPDATGRKDTDLVSLAEIDPTIIIDSVFSRPDNPFHYQFFKENVAYVRYGTAKKIAAVQREFKEQGLGLKVWTAYRPQPVQIKMYDIVGHDGDKVSDPYDPNSKKAHVRAVAIDCTLVDKNGKELEMPTTFLDFANYKKMWITYMDLPEKVIENRALLKRVMNHHDMWGYTKEWWHFQDHEIMDYPAVKKSDFPEVHQKLLVDEILAGWK